MAMVSAFRRLANHAVAGLNSTIFVSTRYSVTQSVSKKVSDRIVMLLAIDPDENRHAIVGLTGHTLLKTLANGGLIDPECHRLEDIAACAGECELQGLTIDGSELAHLRDFLKASFRGEGNAQVETDGGDPWGHWTEKNREQLLQELIEIVAGQKLPLGFNCAFNTKTIYIPIGHLCMLLKVDLVKYMSYEREGTFPDDDNLAQLLMLRGCEPLPRSLSFRSYKDLPDLAIQKAEKPTLWPDPEICMGSRPLSDSF